MTTFTGFFPALEPSTSYSFYNHPLSSRSNVHQTIRGVQPMHAQGSQPVPLSNPGPTTEEIRREARARHRTEKRALVGKRPAGTWLGKEAEELSEEEEAFEDENQNINLFGHRFLLPYGRRQTQMEVNALPSPSPSDADRERRQEDRQEGSPVSPLGGQQLQEEVVEGGEGGVDLDASVEDMDANMDDDEEDEEDVEEDEAGEDEEMEDE